MYCNVSIVYHLFISFTCVFRPELETRGSAPQHEQSIIFIIFKGAHTLVPREAFPSEGETWHAAVLPCFTCKQGRRGHNKQVRTLLTVPVLAQPTSCVANAHTQTNNEPHRCGRVSVWGALFCYFYHTWVLMNTICVCCFFEKHDGLLQFFSIALAQFLKQKLHSQRS